MKAQLYLVLLFILSVVIASTTYAQEDNVDSIIEIEDLTLPRENYLFNSSLSFSIPTPTSNKAFRKSIVGIYQVNGGLDLVVVNGFFVGVNFSSAKFKVDKDIIKDYNIYVNKNYNPRINIYNAAVSVGVNYYLGEKNKMKFETRLSVGQNYSKFLGFKSKSLSNPVSLTDFKSVYGEAVLNLFFLMEPNWGIGPTIGYSLISRSFDPYALSLDDWTSISAGSEIGSIQYLNFGFAVYYNFFKK